MTDSERIAAIEGREKAATKGPWFFDDNGHPDEKLFARDDFEEKVPLTSWNDLEFSAHARADIPWLLERVRGLEAALTLARTLIHEHLSNCDGAAAFTDGLHCAVEEADKALAAAEQARGGEERTNA